jgi:hypothetical protein
MPLSQAVMHQCERRMHGFICYPRLLPTPRCNPFDRPPERRKPENPAICDLQGFRLKRMKGFEPSTFAMARRRSSQLSYIRELLQV